MKRRVHIIIKGKVQGVFFRAAIEEKAKEYVKNQEAHHAKTPNIGISAPNRSGGVALGANL